MSAADASRLRSRHGCRYSPQMIKDRPHRLDLIYINQPLYFVTFATRDRKRIPSLDVAQAALEQYAHRAIENFNVAARQIRDHARSCSSVCSRRSKLYTLIVDRWFEAGDVCGAKIAASLAAWIF